MLTIPQSRRNVGVSKLFGYTKSRSIATVVNRLRSKKRDRCFAIFWD